jgi:sigma-B regulation protein RsbU (phosphoserine phosphatase)
MLKLRWKLLLLLLIVAVVPLIAVRLADVLAMRGLAQKAAAESRQQLLEAAQSQLRLVMEDYARTLGIEDKLLRELLAEQAEAVEQRLAATEVSDEARVFWEADFNNTDEPVPGLEPSALHARGGRDGSIEPQSVTYQHHVTRLSPGVERSATIIAQARRLADLSDDYARIRETFPEAMLWQYTTLANGLHLSYPGKGGYPANYEPRQRRWYEHVMQVDQVCWTTPEPDVTTFTPTFTLGMPIRDAQGNTIGVTAMDIPLISVLGRSRLRTTWAEASIRFMVSIGPETELKQHRVQLEKPEGWSVPPDETWPYVFAQSGGKASQDWRMRAQAWPLMTDDPGAMRAVVDDMINARQAIRVVHTEGTKMVWAYGPISENGADFLLIAVPFEAITAGAASIVEQIDQEMWTSLRSSGLILLLVIALVVFAVWRGSRAISLPVTRLANAARHVADGNLDARVSIRQYMRDELSEMAESFNDMVPKLRDRVRMRESLSLAMEVQQSLLPTAPPKIAGLDLAGHSVYCDETGGDYYDFLEFEPVDARRVGVVIGDVVGHGVAAALLMATARALLRSRVTLPGSISDVFGDVNHQLCSAQFTGRFMTLFYLLIDQEQRQLRWLSAGHDPALVYHPQRDSFEELEGADIPLGLEESWAYHEFDRSGWDAGEVIVIGTDGIWEARNASDEMFGKDRLHDLIRRHANAPAEQIAKAIDASVRQFRGNRDQLDDITLVVVKLID